MKNCFVLLFVVFSLFVNVSHSYAMWQEGEVLDYNHTSRTARYLCKTPGLVTEDAIFPAYVYPGMLYLAGVVTPFAMTALKKKWDAYWEEAAVVEVITPGIIPLNPIAHQPQGSASGQPVAGVGSSGDGSGQARGEGSVSGS